MFWTKTCIDHPSTDFRVPQENMFDMEFVSDIQYGTKYSSEDIFSEISQKFLIAQSFKGDVNTVNSTVFEKILRVASP